MFTTWNPARAVRLWRRHAVYVWLVLLWGSWALAVAAGLTNNVAAALFAGGGLAGAAAGLGAEMRR